RLRRARLRTKVLAGVLAVTLIALVGFDIAAVAALRGYLVGQTDSQLREVLSVYQHVKLQGRPFRPIRPGARPRQRAPAGRAERPAWRPRFLRNRARPLPPPMGLALQVPILQQFGVALVQGKRAKGVSPHVSIRGHTIGNASLPTETPGN